MSIIQHRDVSGALLHFSREQIDSLIEALSTEQRRFSTNLATTIKHPHEIWQAFVADEANKGNWLKVRSYLQYIDLSHIDAGVPFGVAIVQFSYHSRWELSNVGLVFGTEESVMEKVNNTIRTGSIEYSNVQH